MTLSPTNYSTVKIPRRLSYFFINLEETLSVFLFWCWLGILFDQFQTINSVEEPPLWCFDGVGSELVQLPLRGLDRQLLGDAPSFEHFEVGRFFISFRAVYRILACHRLF